MASARTLSRRLRRSNRAELGTTRAQALSHRSALLRKAVVAHWELSDMLGAHYSEFADSVAAADVLGLTKRVSELKVAVADGAWARHSPPPGLSAALDAPNGVSASLLEQFREELYYQPDFAAPVILDAVQIYDEQFGARIVSSGCGEADPLVDQLLTALVGPGFHAKAHLLCDQVECDHDEGELGASCADMTNVQSDSLADVVCEAYVPATAATHITSCGADNAEMMAQTSDHDDEPFAEAGGGSRVLRSGQPASAPALESEEVDVPVCKISDSSDECAESLWMAKYGLDSNSPFFDPDKVVTLEEQLERR